MSQEDSQASLASRYERVNQIEKELVQIEREIEQLRLEKNSAGVSLDFFNQANDKILALQTRQEKLRYEIWQLEQSLPEVK